MNPIETVPRDGTYVFLYWPGCGVMPKAKWDWAEGPNEDGTGGFCLWFLQDEWLNVGGEDDGVLGYEGDPEPTHWIAAPPNTPPRN